MRGKGKVVIGIILFGLLIGGGYMGYQFLTDRTDEVESIPVVLEAEENADDEIAMKDYISTMTLLEEDAITFNAVEEGEFLDGEKMTSNEEISMEVSFLSLQPRQGSVGTIISIAGTNLSTKNIVDITFGTESVPIYNIRDDLIQCVVPSAIVSGSDYEITVNYEDESIIAGLFLVEALDKTILLEGSITEVSNQNNFSSPLANIYIPANAVSEPSVVTIEKVNSQMANNFHEIIQDGDYYDIKIGDQHQFADVISIEIPLPEGYDIDNYTPFVTYFDELKGTWEPMLSQVTDKGTLGIRTDHLSKVGVYWMYNSIVSSDGTFKVYYDVSDSKVSGPSFTTSKELAEVVAKNLVVARTAYDSKLDAKYNLPAPTVMSYKSTYPVVVHSGYSGDGGYYSPASSVIHLPGNYMTVEDLQTTPAHELFHLYQNQVINAYRMKQNLWLTEATAEYASYRLAYDRNPRIRPSSKSIPTNYLYLTNNSHEYTSAAFLDYAFIKTGTNFNDLWNAFVANSNTVYPEGILHSVMGGKSSSPDMSTTNQLYKAFWLEAITDNVPDWCTNPGLLISRTYGVSGTTRVVKAYFKKRSGFSQQLVSFSILGLMDNVPKRIIKTSSTDATLSNVKGIVVTGGTNYKNGDKLIDLLNSQIKSFMKDNQNSWERLQAASGSVDYKLIEMSLNDTLLVAIQPVYGDASVLFREVNAIAKTKEFKDIKMGEEVVVVYGFNNIFTESKALSVETDFGDGTVIKKAYDDVTTINIEGKHMYKDSNAKSITGNLYDVTGGKKELISRIVIPITFDEEVILTASNYTPEVGEEVVFKVNVKNDTYSYEWDLGTEGVLNNDKTTMAYTYKEAGNYSPYVNVTNADGKAIGSGICDIEVAEIPKEDLLEGWNLVGVELYTGYAEGYNSDAEDAIVFEANSVIQDGDKFVNHTSFPDHIKGKEKVSVTIDIRTTNENYYSIGATAHYRILSEDILVSFDGGEDGLIWVSGNGYEGFEKSNSGTLSMKIPKGEFEGDTLELFVGINGAEHKYVYTWHEK